MKTSTPVSSGEFARAAPGSSEQARNGFFLTRDDLTASYAIIRYNVRTYRSDGVIAVIGGKRRAELELKKFEDSQNPSDRQEGWRYLLDKTDLKAGTDPTKATQHRQAELEARETEALRESKTANFSWPDRQR